MILNTILSKCNERQIYRNHDNCNNCSFANFCPGDCKKCLDYIHRPPLAAKNGMPERKYDCPNMADVYTCKYSCRYTSEMIYAFMRMKDLRNLSNLRVLSFGCGPCTDLLALEYLRSRGEMVFNNMEYHGIDYSKNVWENIHGDIKALQTDNFKMEFFYEDACDIIKEIAEGTWTPNVVVFQYVFSDMQKHTSAKQINGFIQTFANYFNQKMERNSYIVLNDINLSISYDGGREYFDKLYGQLENAIRRKGRFRDDNTKSIYYPNGYPYGEDSDGEFAENKNFFNLSPWRSYRPFNTCASAQMIIKKVR